HERGLARVAVNPAAEADDRVTKFTVVHVQRPGPRDRLRIDRERVVVEDRRVQRGGQEVVRGRDRVEIAVEVKVDVLHGDDLRETAPGAASLDPEPGTHGRLAK